MTNQTNSIGMMNRLNAIFLNPTQQIPQIEWRDAKLVTSLALVTMIALVMRLGFGIDPVVLGSLVAIAFAYAISRTRYRKIAGLIIITLLAVPSLSNLATLSPELGNDFGDWVLARVAWIAMPLLLASIFFSWRGTLLSGFLLAVAVGSSVSLNPNLEFSEAIGGIALVGVLTALSVLSVRHRNSVEADRQAQLLQVNRELSDAHDNLEKRVEERTADLNIALEKAERSEQVKSAFLASMSHELRTPLNSVINFTKFVVKGVMGPVNEKQSETLNKVVASGQHLLALINDVLDMSKIESGSLNLFIEEDLKPNQILDTVLATGESLLAEKDVKLIRDIQPELPMMIADKKRITQILLNVISNACKFTEKGTVTVKAIQDGANLLVTVHDTGAGIADEDKDSVFAAFKQTDSGLRQAEGTGLGMPISKSLAEAHGGKLWFESELDKGSTFYIQLPIKTEVTQPVMLEV